MRLEGFDGERKMPLKLRRWWGDLGGESWWEGKMVLGELRSGVDMGLEG